MKKLTITPAPRIEGELAVPGDKSISHRSIIFASLATGTTRITGFLPGEDCLNTLRAFQALGTRIEQTAPDQLIVEGTDRKLSAAMEAIDCGNSGVTMRLLAGVLVGQPFRSKLFGNAALSQSPMKPILDPLGRMGGSITAQGSQETAPLVIEGGALKGITYHSPIPSAQVKSSILLAGLFAQGNTTFKEPTPSRDHTERLFTHFHLPLRTSPEGLTIRGGSDLHAEDLHIPGDFSSAAFWLAGAAAMPGSNLIVRNIGLNTTRTGLLNILVRMGAQIRETIETSVAEPFGSIQITGGQLEGTEIRGAEIPTIIDELPIISAIAALATGQTVIRDLAQLRGQSRDLLAILARNLQAFGVKVEELPDGLVISGGHPIRPARVSSHEDHRIAMASAILALSAHGPSTVEDVDCIDSSYPGFANHLKFLTESSTPKMTDRIWSQLSGKLAKSLATKKPSKPATPVVIAIDGPAASGKSSVSRRLAERLGFGYANTGSIYRGVTWSLLHQQVDVQDHEAVALWLQEHKITCQMHQGVLAMQIDEIDPLPHTRDSSVNENVSTVAAIPQVREALLPLQQSLANFGSLVVEGRDISSVVFPETPYKFYLDAHPDVREARRAGQGEQDAIRKRDLQDSLRATAPLQLVDGAIRIDTSEMNLDEVVEAIVSELQKRGLLNGHSLK